jgi:hypothetical protein
MTLAAAIKPIGAPLAFTPACWEERTMLTLPTPPDTLFQRCSEN